MWIDWYLRWRVCLIPEHLVVDETLPSRHNSVVESKNFVARNDEWGIIGQYFAIKSLSNR